MYKSTPSEVIDAISSERLAQDIRWPRGTGCSRSLGEEILCMEQELLEARVAWNHGSDSDPIAARKIIDGIRKVTAIGCRAMEIHGAVKRVL